MIHDREHCVVCMSTKKTQYLSRVGICGSVRDVHHRFNREDRKCPICRTVSECSDNKSLLLDSSMRGNMMRQELIFIASLDGMHCAKDDENKAIFYYILPSNFKP